MPYHCDVNPHTAQPPHGVTIVFKLLGHTGIENSIEMLTVMLPYQQGMMTSRSAPPPTILHTPATPIHESKKHNYEVRRWVPCIVLYILYCMLLEECTLLYFMSCTCALSNGNSLYITGILYLNIFALSLNYFSIYSIIIWKQNCTLYMYITSCNKL